METEGKSQSETLLQSAMRWKFARGEPTAGTEKPSEGCSVDPPLRNHPFTSAEGTTNDKLYAARYSAGWGVMSVAEIRLQEGESLENALRRFKRKVQTEDIIKEVKRHSYYLKPGERKRVKQALAQKRARKKIRKERD